MVIIAAYGGEAKWARILLQYVSEEKATAVRIVPLGSDVSGPLTTRMQSRPPTSLTQQNILAKLDAHMGKKRAKRNNIAMANFA